MPLIRLLSVENAVGRSAVIEENLTRLDASFSFARTPTEVGGVPNTLYGPPTTGFHPLGDLWSDGLCGIWRCVVAGTPGLWVQLEPACGSAFPVGTIQYLYRFIRADQGWKEYYWDGADWKPVFVTPADTSLRLDVLYLKTPEGDYAPLTLVRRDGELTFNIGAPVP